MEFLVPLQCCTVRAYLTPERKSGINVIPAERKEMPQMRTGNSTHPYPVDASFTAV